MTEQAPSLSDEQIQDLLRVGNPTDEELRLIRMGWDAAMRKQTAPAGWHILQADFSLQACCKASTGRVTLVRDNAGRVAWHLLSEEQKNAVPLYVSGEGRTIFDALDDAAREAMIAPLPESEL